MARLNVEGVSVLFESKLCYMYTILAMMLITFGSQAGIYFGMYVADVSDRTVRMICGYEAIERALLFICLA
ncbi:MAG: hypothetical protein P4M11_12070 [Candidatus Pacebacteria bacterium]|nr:hypothetical protein [Candidatus Paceibacterota bacterium]